MSCITSMSLKAMLYGAILSYLTIQAVSAKFQVGIEDPPGRKHMVFYGGAVLAEIMKNKESFWVSKKEYQENGVDYCLKKLGPQS